MAQRQMRINAEQGSLTLTTGRGARVAIRGVGRETITARLGVKLEFYADEDNNMNIFAFEDRVGHSAPRLREPIEFFGASRGLEVVHGKGDGVGTISLTQTIEGYRVMLTITARKDDRYFVSDLRIANASRMIERLMMVRLCLDGVKVDGKAPREWTSPPIYKNSHFSRGRVNEIVDNDLRLNLPPLGLVQPLVFVGDMEPGDCALEFSPWLDNYGSIMLTRKADLCYSTFVDRYLEPNEEHHVGVALLRAMSEGWRQGISQFARDVPKRFGCEVLPDLPDWARDLRVVAFPGPLFPVGDKRWRAYFEWARDIGCNAFYGYGWTWKEHKNIKCAISPENGTLPLASSRGATEKSIRAHNKMLHDLGLRSILWTPTTGASPHSKSAKQNPEWFIRDEEGELRGSWAEASGDLWLVDSNPLNEGYYRYWKSIVLDARDRGFDGVFFDGAIARPSDAFTYPHPGRIHNGVYTTMQRLRQDLDALGMQDFLIKPESGDVSALRSAYWMNSPPLYLNQCVAPTRKMPEHLKDEKRAFLHPDYPTIDESQFTEHLELACRCWPEGIPGNWHMFGRDMPKALPEDLFPRALARVALTFLAGDIPNIHLNYADKDPSSGCFDGKSDEELGPEKAAVRKEFYALLKRLYQIRARNLAFSRSAPAFDSFKSDDGAVPAFARTWKGKTFLMVVNMSENDKDVTITMDNSERRLALPRADSLKLKDLITNKTFKATKRQLTAGMPLSISKGTAIAWQVR